MSKKTITQRVKRCRNDDLRNAIILKWIDDWKDEQTSLCDRIPVAISIQNFDEMCIVNGLLKEITNKKFTAFYNLLRITGLSDQCENIHQCERYQAELIAVMGQQIAYYEWEEINAVYDKFMEINQMYFPRYKKIFRQHAEPPVIDIETARTNIQAPMKQVVSISKIIELYNKTFSLRETADMCGVNWQKVRKILITEGLYENDISVKINSLYSSGMACDQIASVLNMTTTAVNNYLPYKKGVYNTDLPSLNAERIRKYRKKNSPITPDH